MAKKVNCPECNTEVELSDSGEGKCSKCKLNVGAVLKRVEDKREEERHERAVERLLHPEKENKWF